MWARIGLPATFSSTLGRLYVCGLSRVPKPATGIIACMEVSQSNGAIQRIIPYINTKIRNLAHRGRQLGISGVISYMGKFLFGSLLLLPAVAALPLILAGCSTSSTSVQSQEVFNV